jgi:transcriptional regulator with XRE-family HTH domain
MSDEPSDLDRQIGAALRQARLSRACTQAELAEHLAVGRSALAHYEAGNRPLTVSMLICAARALQYPASQLLPALPDDVPVTSRLSALPEPVAQIARLLTDRPALIPSVLDLLETLLEHERIAHATSKHQEGFRE